MKSKRKIVVLCFIGILMLVALIMRIVACYWGDPQILNIDEQFIMLPALDLIKNHTYICHVVNRPDQVEIKCVALILSIASKILWHADPNAIFDSHPIALHVMGRFFTTCFGVAMIPVSAVFAGKMSEVLSINKIKTPVIIALIFCFFPIYIQHSGYMTPDVPLACMVMLFGLFFIRYLEDGKVFTLIISAVIVGICAMIKWPGLFLCFGIALMVIYRSVNEKKYKDIFVHGIISVITVILTCFIIMPNILSDFPIIMQYMHDESQPRNVEGTRLSMFLQNFFFYFKTSVLYLGCISIIPFIMGLVSIFKKKDKYSLVFIVGLLYWFIISIIPVQWIRWGTPIYLFYILLVGIGISYGFEMINKEGVLKSAYSIVTAILIINIILSGICMTKYMSLPNVCYVGMNDLESMGINPGNSISEWETPFCTWWGTTYYGEFIIDENGKATVKNPESVPEYFVRSRTEPAKFYDAIDASFPLVYYIEPNGNYDQKLLATANIIYSIRYITSKESMVGGWPVWVYKIK